MKVIGINGSPKHNGNTAQSYNIISEEFKKSGIEFEQIHIGHKNIHGCVACGRCAVNKNEKCSMESDIVNDTIQIMKDADGLIIASPVYFSGIAGTMKSFLDRAFYVATVNGGLFRHKVGAAFTTVRRSGGSSALDGLNHYLHYSEMLVASANYWNIIHGLKPGEINEDLEGVQILQTFARNMSWMLKMKESSKSIIEEPEYTKKIATNFIR
jgi:multimeric flavodoxin WrbA